MKNSKLENLAEERTLLANERNMLAYFRTGFASFALGILLIKLFASSSVFVYLGYFASLVGGVFIILGIVYYSIRNKRIRKGKTQLL